jgi:hypothetical protein
MALRAVFLGERIIMALLIGAATVMRGVFLTNSSKVK